jgi:tRNA-intron lyase
MFSEKLTVPRSKKRSRGLKPKQTFPVPISSLTGIEAADDVWRWYDATLNDENDVQVSDADAVKMLSTMGFFGELRKVGEEREKYVSVEEFDPVLPTPSDDDVDTVNVDNLKPPPADASSSDAEVEADDKVKTSNKRWKHRRSSAEVEEKVLILSHYDAFFLTYAVGCLRVAKNDALLSIDDLWNDFCRDDVNFRHRYAAYHHFRAKNWVVRDGVKFGNDFLLYKDGPPFYHASYSVRVQKDRSGLTWAEFSALVRVTESAAKELLVVEVHEDASMSERNLTVSEYLESVVVKEVLVKRWVASQKREEDG